MIETMKFKSIIKLFLLVIAIGLVIIVLPATFAEQTDSGHEVYRDDVHVQKNNLINKVSYVQGLNENEFTLDSWANLSAVLTYTESALAHIAEQMADLENVQLDLETLQMEIEHLENVETTAQMLEIDFFDLETSYRVILEEVQALYSSLDAAYRALVRVDVADDSPDEVSSGDAADEVYDGELDEIYDEEYEEVEFDALLSVTRSEFNRMTVEELAEMAYDGGYAPIEVVPNVAPFNATDELNTCPNVDGVNFVNNVIVDGEVCIGQIELEDAEVEELDVEVEPFDLVSAGTWAAFSAAWVDPSVDVINLTGNVVFHNAATGGANTTRTRTESVRLEGNGYHLILTTRAAINNTLTLGATPNGAMQTLAFNNINLGRVITAQGGGTDSGGAGTAAQQGEGQRTALFTATAAHSQHWNVVFYSDVNTSTTVDPVGANQAGVVWNTTTGTPQRGVLAAGDNDAANANRNNRSALLNMPNSSVTVAGDDNSFTALTSSSSGANMILFNVREFNVFDLSGLNAGTNGDLFAPHTLVNIANRNACHIVSTDTTLTATGNTTLINAPCLVVEEGVTLRVLGGTALTSNHAIIVDSFALFEEGATLELTRNGAGHGIHTVNGSVIFESGSTGDLSRASGGTQGSATAGTALINAHSLIINEDATVDINATGHGHGLWLTHLELKAGTNAVNHASEVDVCLQELTTTQLNVEVSGVNAAGAGAAVRMRGSGNVITVDGRPGIGDSSVRVGGNARVCIVNASTGTGAQPANADDNDAGHFGLSHGLFGSIGVFHMGANSTMDIDAANIAFRTTVQRSHYTMVDGAVKNVYARAGVTGRPAMVFASNYDTGSLPAPTNNRNNSNQFISLSGAGTHLNIEGHTALNNTGTSRNRANFILVGDDSIFRIENGATLTNLSHNTTAKIFFGENVVFDVAEGGTLDVEVRGSVDTDTSAIRFLEVGSASFLVDGGSVTIRATTGSAPLLRAVMGRNQFIVSNAGMLELIHDGTGSNAVAIDFTVGGRTLQTADLFRVTDDRSEVYIRTNQVAISGSDCNDVGTTNNQRIAAWGNGAINCQPNYSGGAVGHQTGRNANNSITRVEVNSGAIFEVSGNTSGAAGIFNAGQLHLRFENPWFVNVENRNTGNGVIFSTAAPNTNTVASLRSHFYGRSTDLALWRNTRVGTTNVFNADVAVGCDIDDPQTAAHCAGQDPIDGSPGISMHSTNFYLSPNVANFAHADLTHGHLTGAGGNAIGTPGVAPSPGIDRGCLDMFIEGEGYSNCAFDGFRNWFNGASLPTTGVDAGWRQIRRMSANNAPPVIDVLRIPTDADQRIFGHVTVQEGNRGARSAHNNEVFVDVEILNDTNQVVQTIYTVPTRTLSVFDSMPADVPHMGVFEALVDFEAQVPGMICPAGTHSFTRMNDEVVICDSNRGTSDVDPFYLTMTRVEIPFEPGITHLPTGYTVRAVEARRTGTAQGRSAGAVGLDGITGATPRYRTIGANFTDDELVRDVTPPEQVTDVIGLINGALRFEGAITPVTTTLTGRGEPGAIVRVARVTAVSSTGESFTEWLENFTGDVIVTGITDWLRNSDGSIATATVGLDGNWTFNIPSNEILQVNQRLSVYISDDVRLGGVNQLGDLIPTPYIPIGDPNIIYNMERANPQGLANMANRYRVANIHLPRTTLTESWTPISTGNIGNMGFHYGNHTEFHDATGANAFDYAYILTVEETPYATFEFIKRRPLPSVLPIAGAQFRLYAWNETTSTWEVAPMVTVTSGTNGIVSLGELAHGSQYRLREHQPAPGFVAPPANHYWVITVGNDGLVTHANGNATTPDIETVGNDLVLVNHHRVNYFAFLKVSDLTDEPLPDAEFDLYRRDENGTTWSQLQEGITSNIDGLVVLEGLRFGGQYRLAETTVPLHYVELPSGHHWILDVDLYDGHIELPAAYGGAPTFTQPEYDEEMILANIRSRVGEFEFMKTEDDGITPLPGAEFELYRFDVVEEDWYSVGEFGSDAYGMVTFDGILTYGSLYRLIETNAPARFRLPPIGHYWLLVVDSYGVVGTPSHHQGAPAFDAVGGLSVPNDLAGVPFSFVKTNEYLYMYEDLNDIDENDTNFARLPGATFTLRRWDAEAGDWSAVLETVTSSTNALTLGLVEFETMISLDGIYRLDETVAPNGFRPPHGYWVITWNIVSERVDIEAHGTVSLVPAFRTVERVGYMYLYVGNFREVPLPGTGGLGVIPLTVIGMLSLLLVALLYVRGKMVDDIEQLKI